MQGGDYDGDCVIAIWDERITENLRDCRPLTYSRPFTEPNGQQLLRKLGDVHQCEQALWEWFQYLVRTQPGKGREYKMAGIAQCSMLHEKHADLAAREEKDCKRTGPVWAGNHGKICRILADFAHKAVDMHAAGYVHDLSDLQNWLDRCTKPIWHEDLPEETMEDVKAWVEGTTRGGHKLDIMDVKEVQYHHLRCCCSCVRIVISQNIFG